MAATGVVTAAVILIATSSYIAMITATRAVMVHPLAHTLLCDSGSPVPQPTAAAMGVAP
jgi:hypothetical protein